MVEIVINAITENIRGGRVFPKYLRLKRSRAPGKEDLSGWPDFQPCFKQRVSSCAMRETRSHVESKRVHVYVYILSYVLENNSGFFYIFPTYFIHRDFVSSIKTFLWIAVELVKRFVNERECFVDLFRRKEWWFLKRMHLIKTTDMSLAR